MKTPLRSGAGLSYIGLAGLVLLASGCERANDGAKTTVSRSLKRQMKPFAEQKEAQARDAAKAMGESFLPEYQTLFDAGICLRCKSAKAPGSCAN